MSDALKKLIDDKAQILADNFKELAYRKLSSGGINTPDLQEDHGNKGLAPVHLSTLEELVHQQKHLMSKEAIKDAENLSHF